ncbi:DegT/DnrJ/EryC1/StrS family aminotransferase [Halomarina oriensis]|uniref:Aminotransferase class I/II-fold pyridoxal phosphate-dependent enzyme n=1 Tax=Halomarina oriensis TaxID=671145 RepID=A0A6B0GQE9_9EURY|nr:DegT/DnrJ/EryC1/StrS family aminotransferase [Halomarina oriensis]MWG36301.1 aminotransferase class I/II-fold pyridoxal phosphate-dependent enzyme [Halomarina oriensis]
MHETIPLFRIDADDRDVEYATRSIRRGSHWANGPFVDEFEERIADYLGVEHAVVVNSGTSALVTALVAHDVGPGDEVVVPSFTFIATANAVRLAGATPVFADIEPETFGLDPDSVRECIGPETAAILPVHPYGGACRIEELVALAAEHDLLLVEDAAEVLGADSNGKPLGTFGHSGALSFCQNKIATTGEGGAVVTNDPEVARNARLFRSHGRASERYFDSAQTGRYVQLGANLRMADVVAAIGCAQMERVEDLVAGRRAAATRLNEGFADVDGVRPHTSPSGRHVYQLYTVELARGVDREALISRLADRNIASKVYWDPAVHQSEYYLGDDESLRVPLSVTDDVAGRVLTLPMFPGLTETETSRVVDAVDEALVEQREVA